MAERDAEFTEFVAGCGPRLLRLSVGLAGDRAGGEDLLQSALAKCYVSWPRVARAASPEAYVRRVVVTTYVSQARRRTALLRPVPEQATASGTDAVDLRMSLATALRHLAPRQRAVVVLRYYEDRGDEDIATTLGCSAATVRSQAMRGLARLREVIGEQAATTWRQP